ncbi:hydroxyacid dehydrogenase [Pararhizobium sp. IMCC21322]|uniref:hydroxyacid dehydrogenase n=1 Tax=Pararhizobium sp. IMCC21322 TaxID=3067903 RepID=UPI0027411C8C|nr:hydroxyacid dehydrogenase [Pararhizobium sp. IMCC21322]
MADIVVSEFMDEAALEAARSLYDVLYEPGLVDDMDTLLAEVANAKALIVRNRTQVRGALLEAATNLKVVGRLGVGLDNIDMEACAAKGIAVHPASGANDLSVAEYVITNALVLLRGAYLSTADVAAGAWPRGRLMGREISGKILGLVGYGAIARETAQRATALGMSIIGFDPFLQQGDPQWGDTEKVSLEELLSRADVVSLHVPLTDDTKNLINESALKSMKPDAILINAARGGVVDEAALAAALRQGHLGGAALDVFETEPVSAQAGSKFADIPNLILTPHIAGVTDESNIRVSEVTVANVLSVLKS